MLDIMLSNLGWNIRADRDVTKSKKLKLVSKVGCSMVNMRRDHAVLSRTLLARCWVCTGKLRFGTIDSISV